MQRNTEESEWTRFSKALAGNKPSPDPESEPESETAAVEARPTVVTPAPMAAPPPPVTSVDPIRDPESVRDPEPVRQPEPAGEPEPVHTPAQAYVPPPTPVIPAAPPAPSPAMGRVALGDEGATLIAEGTTIDGSIRSDRSVTILGSVQGEGTIESQGSVMVEPGATVVARIAAQQITIAGEVTGELACEGKVIITASGRMSGKIAAGSLVMEEGAYFDGQLKMVSRASGREADQSVSR